MTRDERIEFHVPQIEAVEALFGVAATGRRSHIIDVANRLAEAEEWYEAGGATLDWLVMNCTRVIRVTAVCPHCKSRWSINVSVAPELYANDPARIRHLEAAALYAAVRRIDACPAKKPEVTAADLEWFKAVCSEIEKGGTDAAG